MRGLTFRQFEQWPGGLAGKTLCTKTPLRLAFPFNTVCLQLCLLSKQKRDTSGLLPRQKAVKAHLRIGQ